jgi:hypothetical protein
MFNHLNFNKMAQQELNQMVLDKIQNLVNNNQNKVQTMVNNFNQQNRLMEDYLVSIGTKHRKNVEFGINGEIKMRFQGRDYTLHSNALYQLAERFNVPVKFMKRMANSNEQWQKELMEEILNYHSDNLDKRFLIRTVGEEARAVLSDRYRPLNSELLLGAFMEEVQEQGGLIADAFIDDTRLWVETIHPDPVIVNTPKNGQLILAYGAQLANSDFGDGALTMRSFLLQGRCVNGWVARNNVRAVHLGKRLPDQVQFSQETYRLDSETMSSAIRDHARTIFNPASIHKRVEEIKQASETEIDIKTQLEDMFKQGQLLKEEKEGVERVLMEGNPDNGTQGENTLFKLSQALTKKAQDFEPRRMREVQELAGNLIH